MQQLLKFAVLHFIFLILFRKIINFVISCFLECKLLFTFLHSSSLSLLVRIKTRKRFYCFIFLIKNCLPRSGWTVWFLLYCFHFIQLKSLLFPNLGIMEVYQSVLLIWSALETSPATARWQNFSYPTLMIFKKKLPESYLLLSHSEFRVKDI